MDNSLMSFINGILPSETPAEEKLRCYAEEHNVPILRRDAAALIRVLIHSAKPARILEIGTAIGYSAAIMAEILPCAHIDTVEIDPDLVVTARKNFKELGFDSRIRVIAGDAAEVLPSLKYPYDMIFMDAAKGQYIVLYDDAMRLLNAGGLLVCDNCIFYGKILDDPGSAPHKHRTIVTNLRAFLQKMMSDERLAPSLLNVGDGMAVAYKKGETSK